MLTDQSLRRVAAWTGAMGAMLAIAACDGNDDRVDPPPPPPPVTPPASSVSIGGTLAGLSAGTLVLSNNGGDELTLTANGAFRFAQPVASGHAYAVRIVTQPAGQACTLANAEGTATAPVETVSVACVADPATTVPSVPSVPALSYDVRAYRFDWTNPGGATWFRLGADAAGGSNFSLLADGIGGSGYTLQDVSVLSNPALVSVRYALQACNAAGCSGWSASVPADPLRAVGYFKASNAQAGDRFGHRLVISRDGGTLVVMADGESSGATGVDGDQADNSAPRAGAVYVFAQGADGAWRQQAYLKGSNTEAEDVFGTSIAVSDDGSTLAIGALAEASAATGIDGNESDNSAPVAGAVYLFTRDASHRWRQQAYLKASNAQAGDRFGQDVALSGDGNLLVVGASGESSAASGPGGNQADNSALSAGAAYVFARNAGAWTQQAYLKADNASSEARFGYALSLSADGATLAVGAFVDGALGPAAGAAYVFTRSGSVWSQQARLYGANSQAGDRFGIAVALSRDGNTLAVGADSEAGNGTGEADNSMYDAGAAYVFTRTASAWSQQAYLKAPVPDSGDFFGSRLAVSDDGSTLAIGAFAEASGATGLDGDATDNSVNSNGAAYLFTRTGTQWSATRYIKPLVSNVYQQFGNTLSLSGDGRVLAVGSQGDRSTATGINGDRNAMGAASSGAVYLY